MTLLNNTYHFSVAQLMLLTAGAATLTTGLYFSRKKIWIVASCIFLVISQSLIFIDWDSSKYGTISTTILLVTIVIAFQRNRFYSKIRSEVNQLFDSGLIREPIITIESLQDLPPIVRKWMIRSNIIGKPPIQALFIKQRGEMRPKPDGKWMHFRAVQYVNVDDPGFIWKAIIDSGLLIPINAHDRYLHGHGNMLIKSIYTIPIANSRVPEIDQGSLMRFLAEIIWFPSAALATYIRWDYLSETSATATIDDGVSSVSGVFTFHPNGDVKSFEGLRYRDVNYHYALEKWKIDVKGYRVFGSVRIANRAEVSWENNGETFTWLKLEISKLKFKYGRDAGEIVAESSDLLQPYFQLN